MRFYPTTLLIGLTILFWSGPQSPALAQEFRDHPQYAQLTEGMSAFQRLMAEVNFYQASGQWEKATSLLEEVVQIQSFNSALWHQLAEAYNTREQWEKALRAADLAVSLDPAFTHYRLERGVALHELGRHAEAIEDFNEVLASLPGNYQARYLRGISYLETGQLEQAQADFESIRGQGGYGTSVEDVWLAEIAARKGDHQESARKLQPAALIVGATPSPRSNLDSTADLKSGLLSAQPSKKWSAYVGMIGEYNSNVISADDTTALPGGISSRHDLALKFLAGGQYHWIHNDTFRLATGLNVTHTDYESLDLFNTTQLSPYVKSAWQFTKGSSLGFDFSFNQTWLDGRDYRRDFVMRPSLSHRWASTSHVSRVTLSTTVSDYQNQAGGILDRDGTAHYLGFQHSFQVGQTTIQADVGPGWLNTDGAEFDGDFVTMGLSFQRELWWKFVLQPRFRFSNYDYDGTSAFSPAGASRNDTIWQTGVRVSRNIWKNLDGFFNYDYVSNDSNVAAFNYERHLYQLGVTASF